MARRRRRDGRAQTSRATHLGLGTRAGSGQHWRSRSISSASTKVTLPRRRPRGTTSASSRGGLAEVDGELPARRPPGGGCVGFSGAKSSPLSAQCAFFAGRKSWQPGAVAREHALHRLWRRPVAARAVTSPGLAESPSATRVLSVTPPTLTVTYVPGAEARPGWPSDGPGSALGAAHPERSARWSPGAPDLVVRLVLHAALLEERAALVCCGASAPASRLWRDSSASGALRRARRPAPRRPRTAVRCPVGGATGGAELVAVLSSPTAGRRAAASRGARPWPGQRPRELATGGSRPGARLRLARRCRRRGPVWIGVCRRGLAASEGRLMVGRSLTCARSPASSSSRSRSRSN